MPSEGAFIRMDMTKYNETDADAKVKELRQDDASWFCPLTNDKYRKDCFCFCEAWKNVAGYPPAKSEKLFYVHEATCNNGMFTTDRNCQISP